MSWSLSWFLLTLISDHGASLQTGEYSGLFSHRWSSRESVAGQVGPQGRRQTRLDLKIGPENIVKLLERAGLMEAEG